ncbi:MAG TPA: tetratricopeptide repeat protein [Blastocatellia bacterium]|nr:tetratricopeptide repeat protein [Blastocatellia bacterium]
MLTGFLEMVLTAAITVVPFSVAPSSVQARNTIEGRVTTTDHRPLSELRVFLQNDAYSQIATAYTDGAGRFRFTNIASGIYYVQVEPGTLAYDRQTQRVEARAFNERRGGGGEVFRVEIVLKASEPSKTARTDAIPGNEAIHFYQSVPEPAKKEYTNGVKSLSKNDLKAAMTSLNRAIQMFPDYYDALELLGTEYVKQKQYQPALPLLAHALEVNKDGWRAAYSLGIAQFESGQRSEAVRSLRRAVELNPNSANTNMWLGLTLAPDPEARGEAIQALEKAVTLAKDSVPMAYFYLGGLYSKNNQFREAANAFETLLRIAPQIGERDKLKKLIEEYRQKAKAQSNNN